MVKTAWRVAKDARDEAMRKVGIRAYREWVSNGRPVDGDEEAVAEMKAADLAVQDVALQS